MTASIGSWKTFTQVTTNPSGWIFGVAVVGAFFAAVLLYHHWPAGRGKP